MKNLARLSAIFALSVAITAPAVAKPYADKANSRARALIARLKANPPKRPALAAAPILNFTLSPSTPLQGQKLSAYIQSDNNFGGRDLTVDVKVNGASKGTVQSPSRGLFVLPLGLQTEARTSTIEATLYLENTQNNTDIRNAVKALDVDIKRLTTSINSERDATKRKILESQRSEKLALKSELLAQLKKFRYKVGTQNYSYRVQADTSSPTLPKVSAIAPSSGDVRGGTKVIFSGSNFSPNFSVSFGGVASPSVTYVNETTVFAYTPDMGLETGAKDIDLRFNVGGIISNVFIPGGYFATNVVPTPPQKPVAIASGSQRIRLGESAELDGSQSYSNRQTTLDYAWKVVSAPTSSDYTPGQSLGSTQSITVTPSALGSYVFSLVVTEHDTEEHLVSDPSIVQVYVGNAPEPEAAAIILRRGTSGTSQIVANDPDLGGARLYSILTPPTRGGSASVSSAGLVTYQANAEFVGEDPFTVRVTNQSGLHGDVTIRVSVVEFNHAPVPTAPAIQTNTEPGSSQISPNSPDEGLTHTYAIVVPAERGASAVDANGLVTFVPESGFTGTDRIIVKVTNSANPPLFGLANIDITVSANAAPVVSASDIFTLVNVPATSQANVVNEPAQSGAFAVSDPPNGSATVSSSGLVTYTPDSGFSGSDSFQVSYTDNGNPALTGTKTINVIVDQISASAPDITVANGGSATSQISVTSFAPGRSYSYMISTDPEHGSATVSGSGLVTYTPAAPYTGPDSLVVTVRDIEMPALVTTVSIPVTITENHSPMASAPAITVNAGQSGTSQVSVSDQDPGQSFTYSISTQPTKGTASVNSSGLVTYTSTTSFATTDSIGVTVSDNGTPALSATISIPVTVDGPTNQPPVIPDGGGSNSLGFNIRSQGVPYQVGMGLGFGATQTIHDPDGTVVSAVWSFGDGTQEASTDLTTGSILHNYMATGSFTATLTVTDNLGATTSRQLQLDVVNTDIPTAKFTVSPSNGGGGTLPLTVTFDASASGDTDGITQYRWRFGNNATSEVVTTNPVITRTFTSPGNGPGNTIPVRLRTRDANRAQGESTVSVTVGNSSSGAQSQAQFLIGPPREVLLNSPISFDGSRSFNPNVGGSLIAYNWNYGDFLTCPGSSGGCTGTGLTSSYTYPSVGNFNSSLQVQSGGGGLSQRTFQELFVVNEGHAPRAIAKASVTSGVAPLTVNFSGSESYDYDGTIQNITWFFGDGSTPVCDPVCDNTGANVSHVFQNPGFYTVRMITQDDDGNTVSVTMPSIEVTAAPPQPKKKRTVPVDPEREYQRQILAGACYDGSGEACSQLADMYYEDENTNVAQHFKARACTLGYSPACTRKQ